MSVTTAQTRVLYLVYWGALEPLGRSLVVPAVLRLSDLGVDLTLITFEKAADLRQAAEVRSLRASLDGAGVSWRPLRYHKTPKWPATAFDGLVAVVTALLLRRSRRFDVVHARTFIAGPMGYLIARLLGSRFVYHNEGFYPDEQVDGGVWRNGSVAHRVARRIERFLYEHADGVIVLSERARTELKSRSRVKAGDFPVIVVPSAVDLQAFTPPGVPRTREGPLSLVYLGSVGLRYRLDEAGRFAAAVRRLRPGSTLTVVSRAGADLVESMLGVSGLERGAWVQKQLPHEQVPAELQNHDAGLFFLTEGLSEHGCSPTKIGEYWACGLPVVTTPNVSDTDEIAKNLRTGVVVRPKDPNSYDSGARELVELLKDAGLSGRCRQAAETAYSLEAACLRQELLYRDLSR